MRATSSNDHSQPQPGSSVARRKTHSWLFFRIVLGLGGAALVIFPVASGNNYIFSVVGLVMFIVATLLLPAKSRSTIEEKARELGALVVVDGGRYRFPDSSSSVPVQLFVCADRISVLDARFRLLLEIPTAEITSFLALQAEKSWFLEVIWTTHAAEFFYRGISAERLVRVAESALRRVTPARAPVVPQRRAAGA
jgi:hypothetical protein